MDFLPKKNTWLQILFWGSLWTLIPLLLAGDQGIPERLLIRSLITFTGIAFVVILNLEVLLPKLYFREKQALYVLAGLGLIAFVVWLNGWEGAPWAELFNRPSGRPRGGGGRPMASTRHYLRLISDSMPYFTAMLGSALFGIAAFANRKAKEALNMRNEKLETEMKFLKSQINPHFLFNQLNNIYTLTVLKSDRAPENLLKLSGMLRYMLYDCKADTVPLKKEIEYLRHFIDLNLLKDSRGLNVKVELDESRPNLQIAPMLFIPFVENAFKHSKIEDLENGWITIRLTTGDNNVEFEVKNSVPSGGFTKDTEGGIGLENVRRQLELLYPERHELKIEQGEEEFCVFLKLNL